MMHDMHESLPGFSPKQIFHDGCDECERRGADVELALAHMDTQTFRSAWMRAHEWGKGRVTDVSHAEAPVLRLLSAMRNRIMTDALVAATVIPVRMNQLARY
jgi:hypothetical protein